MSAPRGSWWTPEQSAAALRARQQAADAAMAGLDPMSSALRVGTAVPAAMAGLDADSIRRMSMTGYAEIRRRAGLPELDPFEDAYRDFEPPQAPATVSAPEAIAANAGMGMPDFAAMSLEEYAQYRQAAGIGQGAYGRGIMAGSAGKDEWAAAAQARAGRTGLSNANVQEAARPDAGKYLHANDPVQGRQSWYSGQ